VQGDLAYALEHFNDSQPTGLAATSFGWACTVTPSRAPGNTLQT